MATDPVQSITSVERDGPFARSMPAVLAWLASLPPSTEAPYLTVR